jgi:cytochrome c551/c552
VAETPDKIVKKEPDAPARDPIVSHSTSNVLLICALLLMASLGWALYDEAYGQRPWKGIQREFVTRYNRYLTRLKRAKQKDQATGTEKEIKQRPEYQELDQQARDARAAVDPQIKQIDNQVAFIDAQLASITDSYQDRRGRITVANYRVETAKENSKASLRKDVDDLRNKPIVVNTPVSADAKKTKKETLNYAQVEERYLGLKDQKAKLLVQKGDLLKDPDALAKKRDAYLKDNLIGVTTDQIDKLIQGNQKFDYTIKQVNVNGDQLVDRCETCHLGVRSSLELVPADFKVPRKKIDPLARAFVSHPTPELLGIHNPDKFGCSSCHWGNGRATTSVVKGHGDNPYWSFPMFKHENAEAGCQQCHSQDRVLQFAPVLTRGKDIFQERGCVGCHRYEGFDRETDGLSNARQQIKQLEDEVANNDRDARSATAEAGGENTSEEKAQALLARATALHVTNSQLEARIEQLNTQSRYLMQDQKKVGPNLKDVRLKLRRDWIPVWLKDPQAFRPGTKMPTFWYINSEHPFVKNNDKQRADHERQAIAAYLWQNSFEGQVPMQDSGNAAHGEEIFKSIGCLACHSIGEGDQKLGGTFAANLTRVGEKENYDYTVRWIYNPRERWAPYCPKEKRDLTREDYEKNGKPYVFDTHGNSKCPNDGAELQVQNMTVMPNFRLAEQDARDIATYLFSLSNKQALPDASFMDSDQKLAAEGGTLIKQYGCAGCHEIKGFEEEQRIGKELTAEGATPIERLDFALQTKAAENGIDPFTGTDKSRDGKKQEEWYNRKGFFEHKIEEPGIYDKGKEKDWRDHLRMPKPYVNMGADGSDHTELNAITTFLLGSVGADGANVPASYFYNATDQRKDMQDGWWIVKKYNCMGCHNVQVGQKSVLSTLSLYQTPEGKEQLPPALTTEGARVDPDWLLRFLTDPSLSGISEQDLNAAGGAALRDLANKSGINGANSPSAQLPHTPAQSQQGAQSQGNAQSNQNGAQQNQSGTQQGQSNAQTSQQSAPQNNQPRATGGAHYKPQPGANHNGVRTYLRVRMPTFTFSPNELRTLVRFFMAVSSQTEPYIKPQIAPLTDQERNLARALFTSQQAPCLKCHLTGNPAHDQNATAPNFLQASTRLKPGWTFRWLLDPQKVIPGTAMPSELFKRDGERWVFNGQIAGLDEYHGDHADLLVRYILQLTPQEQARLAAGSPGATAGRTSTGGTGNTPPAPATTSGTHHASRAVAMSRRPRYKSQARASMRAQMRTGSRAAHARAPVSFAPGGVWDAVPLARGRL